MKKPISYDELSAQVHEVYYSLKDQTETQKHNSLKKQFRLTTTQLWEILGIKDELDFVEHDLQRSGDIN
jgi:hypothetical protein